MVHLRGTSALTPLLAALLLFSSAVSASEGPATYEVAGLEQPAEILVDTWGVPHIYARTHYDAFFVQGFNAARDRLWQIDTWRRRGLGLLSEVLGAGYVAQDRAARLFLYRGDMYREWLAYGSDAKRIAEAFVAGINAYVDLVEADPKLLPAEFQLLGYSPSHWQAADVVRIRSNGLWRNVSTEVARAKLICAAGGGTEGAAVAARWFRLLPDWPLTAPAGFDACDVPADVLNDYHLAKAPVVFGNPDEALAAAVAHETREGIGSNNWVVAPSRTRTGRPILADDPHRGHAVPSLRYIAHLQAPGLSVIGAGEPALPGISIGHNGQIAFGLTIFPIDQEDLYFYARGDAETHYVGPGGETPLRTITEQIPVKDGQSVPVTLRFTEHGPVVFEENDRIWAVRAAWLDAGMAPYFGSVEYMRAQNWREFLAALNRWGAPSENQVYADVEGNIGYKPAGLFPKRVGYDGVLPVPGDGRYRWDGYFDMDVLPEEFNPERGFTGSANSMNLPADYPIAKYPVGFEWSAPWRYERLWEVLASQPKHTLEDSKALQRDYHGVLARQLLTSIPKLSTRGRAGRMLARWNHNLDADSAPAALWAVWYYRHLTPALISHLMPMVAEPPTSLDTLTVLEMVAGAAQEPAVDALLSQTLDAAFAECASLLGDKPRRWRWGDLHRIAFAHPLLKQADAKLAQLMSIADYPRGGSANTTNNTGFRAEDFRVRSGASFRMVLDVGNWDAARMTNAPGQSGDPRSPLYDNLLEGWATEEDFPLLWSREAIEKATVHTINLQPATDP